MLKRGGAASLRLEMDLKRVYALTIFIYMQSFCPLKSICPIENKPIKLISLYLILTIYFQFLKHFGEEGNIWHLQMNFLCSFTQDLQKLTNQNQRLSLTVIFPHLIRTLYGMVANKITIHQKLISNSKI